MLIYYSFFCFGIHILTFSLEFEDIKKDNEVDGRNHTKFCVIYVIYFLLYQMFKVFMFYKINYDNYFKMMGISFFS